MIEERIREACRRSGRSRSEVQVVAVTKYGTVEQMKSVMDAGYTHVGENRWQDAAPKWEALGQRGIWHFIGQLQTNKVREVVGRFAYIHSLDRLSLAREIDKRAAGLDITVNCFIQVNVSGEASKSGLEPDQLREFAGLLRPYSRIRVAGLMTMAPHEDAEAVRPVFRELRRLRDSLNEQELFPYPVEHLSMGMSNDFEAAIEEGATWIRLGSVLMEELRDKVTEAGQ